MLTCSGVSGIKRSRYAHQVTLASLATLAKDAFSACDESSNYDEWKNQISNASATAKFWFTVIDLETILFMFIRSLRTSDEMIPWLAALDHYLRWGAVFLHDIKHLLRSVLEAFFQGHFTVKKDI